MLRSAPLWRGALLIRVHACVVGPGSASHHFALRRVRDTHP